MCGCGGKRNGSIPRSRAPIAPFNQPRLTGAISNNLKPMGVVKLPPPSPQNEADRRRIQKMRQDALIKNLGKI